MLHQRRPVGFLGRRIGFGDETRATEIDGRLPGVSGVGPGFAVDVDVLLEHPHILVPHDRNSPWPALPAAGNVSTLTAAMRISGVGCCTGCGTTVTAWVSENLAV